MTLDSLATVTINVIRKDGIAQYMPTIVLSATHEVVVVDGVPADVDHRVAVQNVVRRSGYDTTEFFFAVRSARDTITLGHFRPGVPTKFLAIVQKGKDYSTAPITGHDWWTIR
jgi:hypothetical protein